MKLENLYEREHDDSDVVTVANALMTYLSDNGIMSVKIGHPFPSVYDDGSWAKVQQIMVGNITIVVRSNGVVRIWPSTKDTRYLALEVDIHDPDSFPKVLEFVKAQSNAREDVIGRHRLGY